jgi:hypothetical protein
MGEGMSNQGGRPRIIESPEAMMEMIDSFCQQCQDEKKPLTLTGLIRHMGLSSRQSLDEYAKYEGFSDPVKRAKLAVEEAYEERLHTQSPTGAIFALKNMGWTDRQEISTPDLKPVSRVQIEVIGATPDPSDETAS